MHGATIKILNMQIFNNLFSLHFMVLYTLVPSKCAKNNVLFCVYSMCEWQIVNIDLC